MCSDRDIGNRNATTPKWRNLHLSSTRCFSPHSSIHYSLYQPFTTNASELNTSFIIDKKYVISVPNMGKPNSGGNQSLLATIREMLPLEPLDFSYNMSKVSAHWFLISASLSYIYACRKIQNGFSQRALLSYQWSPTNSTLLVQTIASLEFAWCGSRESGCSLFSFYDQLYLFPHSIQGDWDSGRVEGSGRASSGRDCESSIRSAISEKEVCYSNTS